MFANDGNIVLALAGHDAGVAANAGGQVNHHAPLLALNVHQFGAAPFVVPKTALVLTLLCRAKPVIHPVYPSPTDTRVIPLHEVGGVVDAVQIKMFYKILVPSVVGVALAHHRAAVHDPLLLCAGNFVGITSFSSLAPVATCCVPVVRAW